MAIKLQWTNNNIRPITTEIYRSATPIDRAALPAPLVSITDGATSYVDATAVQGQTYYYLMATKEGNSRVFSPQRKITVENIRGYGPNQFLWGDEQLGYFGAIPAGEFLGLADLLNAALTSVGLPTTPVSVGWHKFCRYNKVIYVPDKPIGNAAWMDLYNAGLVYGVDGPGPANMTLSITVVNQRRPIQFQGNTYVPRLLRGYWDKYEDLAALVAGDAPNIYAWALTGNLPAPPATAIGLHDALVNPPQCEFNDLMYSLFTATPKRQRGQTVAELPLSNYIGLTSQYADANYVAYAQRRILCQERRPAMAGANAQAITRMSTWYQSSGYNIEQPLTQAQTITWGVSNQAGGAAWVPAIELDEQVVTL